MRRDIERDVAWYRDNGPTEVAAQVARQGESTPLGVHPVGGGGGPDGLADTGADHPEPVVGAEIGVLPRSREPEVVAALARAFDLELPVTDDDW